MTLVFEKNANFFAENCQNSQKIVIITSIPGCVTRIKWVYICMSFEWAVGIVLTLVYACT
jgi:hypothetical protein